MKLPSNEDLARALTRRQRRILQNIRDGHHPFSDVDGARADDAEALQTKGLIDRNSRGDRWNLTVRGLSVVGAVDALTAHPIEWTDVPAHPRPAPSPGDRDPRTICGECLARSLQSIAVTPPKAIAIATRLVKDAAIPVHDGFAYDRRSETALPWAEWVFARDEIRVTLTVRIADKPLRASVIVSSQGRAYRPSAAGIFGLLYLQVTGLAQTIEHALARPLVAARTPARSPASSTKKARRR